MVLDIKQGNEWQFLSKEGDCILPWFTRDSLDVLERMSIHFVDKVVFEYGIGLSTIWFAKHSKMVYGIETNREWYDNVCETLTFHGLLSKTKLVYAGADPIYSDYVFSAVPFTEKDIIVIDGQFRDLAALAAIRNAKKGTVVILDNYLQPSVHVASREVQDLVNENTHTIYKQQGHPDWATCLLLKD